MGRSSLSTSCMKIMMFSLNILIWFLGVLILVAGICFRIDQSTWDAGSAQLQGFTNAFCVVIVIGAILFVVGFLGCWGVLRENSISLGVYFVIVLILFILEIAAIVLVWKSGNGTKLRSKFSDILKEQLNQDINSRQDYSRSFIEYVEIKLDCCGADGPLDYQIVPESCNNENQVLNERGCAEALMKFFDIRIGVIGGVCIGLLILQAASLVMTFLLIKNFRSSGKPCVEVAADDVQLAYVPGQHYHPEKSVKIKEVNETEPSKEEAKLIKAQKKKEAREAKEAEKLRKAEEKKQKESQNAKEKSKVEEEETMKPVEKQEAEEKEEKEELKKDAESTTSKDSRDKELQAEQKKLAEEAQKMLQEKRRKNTEKEPSQGAATEKESEV